MQAHIDQGITGLLHLTPEEIGKVDIAMVNLLCAEGLNGSENLDISQCMETLDQWADHVREDTESRMPTFYGDPAKYDNSVNLFKVANMVLALKNDIGVDYNPEIMKRTTFP
ncbi:MAG TPA: hypothetical protein ENK70_08000, partial [Methylophaga sp.]|nr:hypothetical protein [Methylophaga sp.]